MAYRKVPTQLRLRESHQSPTFNNNFKHKKGPPDVTLTFGGRVMTNLGSSMTQSEKFGIHCVR